MLEKSLKYIWILSASGILVSGHHNPPNSSITSAFLNCWAAPLPHQREQGLTEPAVTCWRSGVVALSSCWGDVFRCRGCQQRVPQMHKHLSGSSHCPALPTAWYSQSRLCSTLAPEHLFYSQGRIKKIKKKWFNFCKGNLKAHSFSTVKNSVSEKVLRCSIHEQHTNSAKALPEYFTVWLYKCLIWV